MENFKPMKRKTKLTWEDIQDKIFYMHNTSKKEIVIQHFFDRFENGEKPRWHNEITHCYGNLKLISKQFVEYINEEFLNTSKTKISTDDFIITGGAITSMLLNKSVNDYDIFFTNIDKAITIADKINEKVFNNSLRLFKENVTNTNGYITCRTENVNVEQIQQTLKLDDNGSSSGNSIEYVNFGDDVDIGASWNAITIVGLNDSAIQIVLKTAGTPEFIHQHFDFVHCTNYFWNDNLFLNEDACKSAMFKKLNYIGSFSPLSTFMRITKFTNIGWRISKEDMIKIAFDIINLNVLHPKNVEANLKTVGLSKLYDFMKKNGISKENVTAYEIAVEKGEVGWDALVKNDFEMEDTKPTVLPCIPWTASNSARKAESFGII
jgi:hypothetical protein